MDLPAVEADSGELDLARIYYRERGDGAEATVRESRVDVGSRIFDRASVVLATAEYGAALRDIEYATLMLAARTCCFDMMISKTVPMLNQLSARADKTYDGEYAVHLAAVAEEGLRGVALVGALRSVAYALWKHREHIGGDGRKDLIARARNEVVASGADCGYADLVADDAHAHLIYAEHMKDETELPPEVVQVQHLIARIGYRLLAIAIAIAARESWNPFTYHRISSEMGHHTGAAARLADEDKGAIDLVQHLYRAYVAQEAECQKYWQMKTKELGDDLLAALWTVSKRPVRQQMNTRTSNLVDQLIHMEPTWARIV